MVFFTYISVVLGVLDMLDMVLSKEICHDHILTSKREVRGGRGV